MRLVEDNKDIGSIVHPYNLRGYSFREYLNITLGLKLPVYSLEDILKHHVEIAQKICQVVKPLQYFDDYLHHGYYPLFLEQHDFSESLLKMMNMMLDVDARNAYNDGNLMDLTAKEFDLIELLMRNPNRVYSRENLLDTIWGYEYRSDIRTVDVHIRRLREKMERNPAEPEHILTKWGVGYYFKK